MRREFSCSLWPKFRGLVAGYGVRLFNFGDFGDDYLFDRVVDPEVENELFRDEMENLATGGVSRSKIRDQKRIGDQLVGAVQKFSLTTFAEKDEELFGRGGEDRFIAQAISHGDGALLTPPES